MELSIFLAKLFGLYLIIVSLAALVNRKKIQSFIDSASENIPLLFVSGVIFLILGLAVVISHNIWVADWPVLITILGWLTLVKACLRLFFPEKIKPLAMRFIKAVPVVCFIFLLVGIYLAYTGFILS
ncbi:MAG: hypothetical protein AAB847_01275 [Patescibacteria group bacterium]